MVTVEELVARIACDGWLRVYDTAGASSVDSRNMEPIYDAEADGIGEYENWALICREDVILIRAVEDPDTVGPVMEIYI